jgi:hypothetical protein
MVGGGLIEKTIFSKLSCFGTSGVIIFQGAKIGNT